jgi:hypothetical protein
MSLTAAVECLARGDVAGFINNVRTSIEAFASDPVSAMTNAIDAVATGASMIVDDIADLGRFDRVHHWHWGLLLLVLGLVAIAVAVLLMLTKPF